LLFLQTFIQTQIQTHLEFQSAQDAVSLVLDLLSLLFGGAEFMRDAYELGVELVFHHRGVEAFGHGNFIGWR